MICFVLLLVIFGNQVVMNVMALLEVKRHYQSYQHTQTTLKLQEFLFISLIYICFSFYLQQKSINKIFFLKFLNDCSISIIKYHQVQSTQLQSSYLLIFSLWMSKRTINSLFSWQIRLKNHLKNINILLRWRHSRKNKQKLWKNKLSEIKKKLAAPSFECRFSINWCENYFHSSQWIVKFIQYIELNNVYALIHTSGFNVSVPLKSCVKREIEKQV